MWELMLSAWQTELVNYPNLLMQSAALLGVFSVVLMMSNASATSLHSRASFNRSAPHAQGGIPGA